MEIQTTVTGQRLSESPQEMVVEKPVKYCLYARKSTESEERQVRSIDSQINEMLQLAEREDLDIAEIRRESHSAKETNKRPVFNKILEDIRREKFNGILTWAPDRLSRNAGDLGAIVDLIDQKLLVEIRTHSQTFTDNPNEKFLLMILGSQAKLENDNRSINVKRGMKARAEMGLWPHLAPLGYMNMMRSDKKCHVVPDPKRAPIIKQMFERVAHQKQSGRQLYNWLVHDLNFYTRGNKHITQSAVYRVLDNPFYYGTFEFPRDSGNWYQGKHKPIITQELFEKAQEQLKRGNIVQERHEFAFTKLFTCGLCGSGITAQEKYKTLKDGTSRKYIYYSCTRARDRNCKNKYVREDELIKHLVKIIDKVDVNELGIRIQMEDEIKRFNLLRKVVDRHSGTLKLEENDVNMRDYAKYLLKEGTTSEKRDLLANLKSRIVIADKKVSLS